MIETVVTSVIASVIAGSVTGILSQRAMRRVETELMATSERVRKLEDDKIAALETRDEKLQSEITLLVSELKSSLQNAIDYGVQGRQAIHERLNNEMVTRREFNQRFDSLQEVVVDIRGNIKDAVLRAEQASRDCAKLEGQVQTMRHRS